MVMGWCNVLTLFYLFRFSFFSGGHHYGSVLKQLWVQAVKYTNEGHIYGTIQSTFYVPYTVIDFDMLLSINIRMC